MSTKPTVPFLVVGLAAAFALLVRMATAADTNATAFPYLPDDHPAINYEDRPPQDRLTQLQSRIDSGEIVLEFDTKWGYLPALLRRLEINTDSQLLVFSKTSVQAAKISPRSPRALYFTDDVVVGFVPTGDFLEFAAADPQQGTIFYTMSRQPSRKPRFDRVTGGCLNCHMIPGTLNIPGLLTTSVIPRPDGAPRFSASAVMVDHRTPLDQRWGGWYVTGTSGGLVHRGNAVSPNPENPSMLDQRNTQNLTDLAGRLDTKAYLAPSSDIVALMTMEHQTHMSNLLTRLNWETRIATHDQRLAEFRPRMDAVVEELVSYMFFVDEAAFYSPAAGSSTFAQTFPAKGPHDKQGRSLRDFDLQKRLFRYPLSYMIYSAAFDGLPSPAKEAVYNRLFAILSGGAGEKYATLTSVDRQAILEILRETKPNLPASWRQDVAQ